MSNTNSTTTSKKTPPQFGRPLIPYFLGESTNGELKINEDLALPHVVKQKQQELYIPKFVSLNV
jgi:hypothetical protein